MKKRNLKSLKLNKKSISNFNNEKLKGGSLSTSIEFPNGVNLCEYTYQPGCASFALTC